MEQEEVSFCIDSYTLLNQYEFGDSPLPNNFQNSNGVAVPEVIRKRFISGLILIKKGVTVNAERDFSLLHILIYARK